MVSDGGELPAITQEEISPAPAPAGIPTGESPAGIPAGESPLPEVPAPSPAGVPSGDTPLPESPAPAPAGETPLPEDLTDDEVAVVAGAPPIYDAPALVDGAPAATPATGPVAAAPVAAPQAAPPVGLVVDIDVDVDVDVSVTVAPAPVAPTLGRRLLAMASRVRGALVGGRQLQQDMLVAGGTAPDPLAADGYIMPEDVMAGAQALAAVGGNMDACWGSVLGRCDCRLLNCCSGYRASRCMRRPRLLQCHPPRAPQWLNVGWCLRVHPTHPPAHPQIRLLTRRQCLRRWLGPSAAG